MTKGDRAKQAIRERMWSLLEQEQAVPPDVHGRIPAFSGAGQAADRLAQLSVWRDARAVKAVPDTAQEPARARALREGKLLYMAVPRLAAEMPFYRLDPATLTISPEEAASKDVTAQVAPKVGVDEMRPVDLVICGSVAVNQQGVRLGKGAGYSDISGSDHHSTRGDQVRNTETPEGTHMGGPHSRQDRGYSPAGSSPAND